MKFPTMWYVRQAYAQADQSLCKSFEFSMTLLLTEQHLVFLSLKTSCTGLSESTLVKCHIVGNHMSGSNDIPILQGNECHFILSVTSHIKCIVACWQINFVYLKAYAFIR